MMNEAAFKALQHRNLENCGHFDAFETAFVERELTAARARTYQIAYPADVARNFIPKATDIPSDADTFSYKVMDIVGKAKLITYQSKDLPRVDVGGREVFGKVVPVGASYGWNINELRTAARLNMPLSDMKATAARNRVEFQIDSLLMFGSIADELGTLPDIGLQGLANNPDVVTLSILAAGFWTGGAVDPDVVLAQLSALAAASMNATNSTFVADTLLLPTAINTYIQQTPYSALTGESILSVFQKNNRQITTVAPMWKLNAAGVSGAPRAIAYKKSPDILEAVIPQEFEVLPPEMQTLEVLNNCHARCGGTKIYQPLGVKYMDFALS